MSKFQVTFTSDTTRTIRNIIAHSTIQAIITALRTVPPFSGAVVITAKPERLAA